MVDLLSITEANQVGRCTANWDMHACTELTGPAQLPASACSIPAILVHNIPVISIKENFEQQGQTPQFWMAYLDLRLCIFSAFFEFEYVLSALCV